jgi:hypothetical protein
MQRRELQVKGFAKILARIPETTPWSARVSTSRDPLAAQVLDQVQDAPEQVTRGGDFRHLEDRVSGVGDDLR